MIYSTPFSYKIGIILILCLVLSIIYICIRIDRYRNFKKVYVSSDDLREANDKWKVANIFKEKKMYIYLKRVCIIFERTVNFSDMDDIDIEIIALVKVKNGKDNMRLAVKNFNKMDQSLINRVISNFYLTKAVNEFFCNESLIQTFYENRETLEKRILIKINEMLSEIGFEAERLIFDFKDNYIETLSYKMMQAAKKEY